MMHSHLLVPPLDWKWYKILIIVGAAVPFVNENWLIQLSSALGIIS